MPERKRPPSLWADWRPGAEPAPPPSAPPRAAPTAEPSAVGASPPARAASGAAVWALGISGLALATTLGIGLLLALVAKDTWLLGFVGQDAGLAVEVARQSVEVPFGGLRLFEDSEEPFVYGLVLPAALVAATAATAARRLPGPHFASVRRRRLTAAAAALPYALCLLVVGAVASDGGASTSLARLLLWSLVLVGGGAALGASRPDRAVLPRVRALARALYAPMFASWAILTVLLTGWLVGLTLTQQSMRIGYELRESIRQVPRVQRVEDLRLPSAPSLAVLATYPANLGLEGLISGVLAEAEGTAPLGSTDGAVDELGARERRQFLACSLRIEEGVCSDVRVLDSPDHLPDLVGWLLVVLVVGTTLGGAAVSGSRAARLAPDDAIARVLFGALAGPAWAVVLWGYDATTDSSFDGWSVFWSALLMTTLAGVVGGGTARAPVRTT